MMYRMQRMKQYLILGLLVMMLLSSCSSVSNNPYADSEPPLEEEEEGEEEAAAQQLEQQLMAMLNLNSEESQPVSSDASLDQAAAFYLEYVLQNPEEYVTENSEDNYIQAFLEGRNIYVLAYDGNLPAVQVGEKVLIALQEIKEDQPELIYKVLKSIAVAYGEGENGSAWVVLIFYSKGV